MLSEFIERHKAKSDLNKCFMNADLYQTYKNSGGRQFHTFPKIQAVEFIDDYIRYVFRCLMGWIQKKS